MNQFIKPLRELITSENGCVSNLAVVIVTWRDHVYTAGCLHSLLVSSQRPRWIVVVDNGSGDQTSQCLHEFLAGCCEIAVHDPFSGRDIKINIQNYDDIINYDSITDISNKILSPIPPEKTLVHLITAKTNDGFASGNNIGIKYLEKTGFQGCIWMLNNDTYVALDCIEKLVLNGKEQSYQDIFGTVLVEYSEPKIIQALGGNISKPWLSPKHNLAGFVLSNIPNQKKFISADYPIGASMLSWSDRLYEEKQPLYEEYFLYYEEADLCAELGVSRCLIYVNTVVAHIGGAATGAKKLNRKEKKYSFTRDYYGTRSRVIYCKKHFSKYIFHVSLFFVALILKRLIYFQKKMSMAVMYGLLSGIFFKLK